MFRNIIPVVFSIAIFLLMSSQANAIVNIEKIGIGNIEEPVEGEIDFNISGASGNSDTQSVSLGSRIQWNDISTKFLVLKYDYSRSSNTTYTDKTFLHYRYIDHAYHKTSWEIFLQIQNDEIKLLNLRTLIGAGYRIRLFSNKNKSLARLGLGLFYSREDQNDTNQTTDELTRANIYFTYQYKINNGISFLSTTYYQPDIENTSDYRALEQFSLEFNLANNFLYFMTVDFSYDNDPVIGLEKDDTSYKSGIKFKF